MIQTYKTLYCRNEKIHYLAKKMQIIENIPSCNAINDAIILPRRVKEYRSQDIPYQGLGGVVDSNGNFVKESAIYDLINTPKQTQKIAFGGAYDYSKPKLSDHVAIYMGLAHQHWGHFLIDIVQRCWYPIVKGLLDCIYEQYQNYNDDIILSDDYVFAFAGFGDGSTNFKENYLEFFRLLGLETERIVFINQPTKFKQVIIPDIAVYPGEYIHSIFQEVFEIVCKNAMTKISNKHPVNKIYFSRVHLKNKKDMGEKSIEALMKKCGFDVLYPEEMSLLEQIYCWQTAKEIACINGTIPHNCVFASSNLSLYVFNKMERMVGYQFTMDAVWGNTPVYISAYKEPFKRYPLSVSRGPFWISMTEDVLKFAKDYFDVDYNGTEKKFSEWIRYILLCIIVELKYQFRDSKALCKKNFNKLTKIFNMVRYYLSKR